MIHSKRQSNIDIITGGTVTASGKDSDANRARSSAAYDREMAIRPWRIRDTQETIENNTQDNDTKDQNPVTDHRKTSTKQSQKTFDGVI